MNEEKIARINELRKEYIASVRNNLKGQLDSITIVNPDGTSRNLGKEHKKRTLH